MNNCENCIDNRPRIGRLAGVTRTLRLAIYEGEGVPKGTPQDLTGNDVVVRVLRDGTDDIYLPGFVVEGDGHNVIKFDWPAAEQAVGNYTIDATVTDGSGNVNRVNWHGPTGIRLVEYSYQEYGEDAVGQASSEGIRLVGYYTTNGVGMSAYDEWLGSPESEGWPHTVSGFMAYLKQPATDAAAALEQVVNEKMAEVDETMGEVQEQADADHTRAESDHARAESDHTTATGDHTRAEADHAQAVTDSQQAATDHQQAESDAAAAAIDREKAAADRTKAADDRQQAAADHATAAQDHATAGSDHQQAQSDHSTASADHTQAVQDAERAASDHTRAGDDHDTAVADHQQAEADHTRAEQDHTASAAATGAANEAAQTATEAADAADEARESIEVELAGKTDKPSSATEGNFAKFDANRNPVDAGYSASRIHRDLGYNAAQKTITLTAGETGKYVKCSTRAAVANSSFNISAPFDVEACSELLIKTGYNPSDSSHASLDISVIAIYEEMERTRTIQKKNDSNQPLYYEVDEDGNPTTTETTTVTDYPVYTTETYTEHRYLPNNEDRWVAIPDSGYYVANIPQSCKCVVSYKPGVTDLTVVVVKHGALANLTSQIFGIYEHRTMAEAVVSLAVRLGALEKRIQQPGNLKVGTIDAVTITRYLYPDVLEQDGAPSATVRPTNIDDALPWDGIPVYPGQRLHDNTNKKVYEGFAPCTAISDWVLLN